MITMPETKIVTFNINVRNVCTKVVSESDVKNLRNSIEKAIIDHCLKYHHIDATVQDS